MFLLLSRLLLGARRQPPIQPLLDDQVNRYKAANSNVAGLSDRQKIEVQTASAQKKGTVSVVVPTLNEAHRVTPCLMGLSAQGADVGEIVVVDSRSTDGTQAVVDQWAQQDSRIRLMTDEPLPDGWVGRPWALQTGFLHSDAASEWVLGVDADTQPQPGLVASLLHEAIAQGYDMVSLSPRFILRSPGEWWLQPALLMTLIYRYDSAGVQKPGTERVMANGQCFLARRSVLSALGGYRCAASSFCDDVTLVREAARRGFCVGFLDGAQVISVRMYEGLQETWLGWGRSLDLKDATTPGQLWSDLWLLVATQGLPVLLIGPLAWAWWEEARSPMLLAAIALNSVLLLIRFGMQAAVAGSYQWPEAGSYQWPEAGSGLRRHRLGAWASASCFWLAPFADPFAVLRIVLSAFQQSITWRGQVYQKGPSSL